MSVEGHSTVEHWHQWTDERYASPVPAQTSNLEGYLEKLGLGEHVPRTLGGIALIQTAHLRRIPYSTVRHFVDESEPLEPTRIIERIVETGHGGYCFELNNALFTLLQSLGFDAQRHLATISRQSSPSEVAPSEINHMTMTVHNLPTDTNPGGIWLTDVGLGDGPYDPLPLLAGAYRQRGLEYSLEQQSRAGHWRLWHHPLGSFSSMTFNVADDVGIDTLNASHLALIGSPTSRFVRNLIVEKRPSLDSDIDAIDTLINCELQRRQGRILNIEELADQSVWFSKLHEVFGLALDEFSNDEKQELWHRVLAAHNMRKQSK